MPTTPRPLKDLREERSLTAEMLAALAKHRVSASTISRIERGVVVPERRTREDIAIALGVRVEDILWPESAAAAS